jgi:hypothetical protein
VKSWGWKSICCPKLNVWVIPIKDEKYDSVGLILWEGEIMGVNSIKNRIEVCRSCEGESGGVDCTNVSNGGIMGSSLSLRDDVIDIIIDDIIINIVRSE